MSRKTDASSEERTTIGKIVGTHGVRGTMLLLPLTDYPERFLGMEELVLDRPGKPRCTLKVRRLVPYEGKGTFFLDAEGVGDKDSAEAFRGGVVTVANEERVALSEDEYWTDDIIGLKAVENGTGRDLGVLEEIMFTGSNDVYLIRTADGTLKPIPALDSVVNSVDIAGGIMIVTIPEGLWD